MPIGGRFQNLTTTVNTVNTLDPNTALPVATPQICQVLAPLETCRRRCSAMQLPTPGNVDALDVGGPVTQAEDERSRPARHHGIGVEEATGTRASPGTAWNVPAVVDTGEV